MVVRHLARRVGVKREVEFDNTGPILRKLVRSSIAPEHNVLWHRMAITAIAVATIAGTTLALPTAADARWGGWHGGGWRGGGWRGGGWGWGVGPGFALGLGLGAAPYYAYGGPYYGSYAYGGDCVMRRRAVINRWGHRVWRWVRVCY
jgi:hypothetical protein